VESYAAAERRITELAQANSDLNAALAQFEYEPQQYQPETSFGAAQLAQPEYAYDPNDQAAELARMQYLAQQAHAYQDSSRDALGGYQPPPSPGLPPGLQAAVTEIIQSRSAQNLTAQAEELVASSVHDWQAVKPQVTSLLGSNPEWQRALQEAAQTSSAANVAGVLSSAVSAVQANRTHSREMKLAAQGLVGAGGKPSRQSEEQEGWARIVNAGNRTYSELMQGR
jgi:hypothetical protein